MSHEDDPIRAAWAATDRPVIAQALATACAGVGLAYNGRWRQVPSAVAGKAVVLVDLSSGSRNAGTQSTDVVILLAPSVMTRALLDALRRGADAVLTTDDGLEALDAALRAVISGEASASASASRLLLTWHRNRRADDHRPLDLKLSARERDVLRAMVDGLTIKGTARRLGVAIKTVEAHRRRLFDRLGVSTQTEAVTLALSDPHLVTPSRSQGYRLG